MNPVEQKERATQVQRLDRRIDSLQARLQEVTEAWDAEIKEQVDKLHGTINQKWDHAITVCDQSLTESITAEGQQRQREIGGERTQRLQTAKEQNARIESIHAYGKQRLSEFTGMGFFARLRWLLTGKL